jgi:hypothetical protein
LSSEAMNSAADVMAKVQAVRLFAVISSLLGSDWSLT